MFYNCQCYSVTLTVMQILVKNKAKNQSTVVFPRARAALVRSVARAAAAVRGDTSCRDCSTWLCSAGESLLNCLVPVKLEAVNLPPIPRKDTKHILIKEIAG